MIRHTRILKALTLILALTGITGSAMAQKSGDARKAPGKAAPETADGRRIAALDFQIRSVRKRQINNVGTIGHVDFSKNDNTAIDVNFSAKQAEGTKLEEFRVNANVFLDNGSTTKKQMKAPGTARSASLLFPLPEGGIWSAEIEVTAFCRNLKSGKVYSSIVKMAGIFSKSGDLVKR
jgi:hypothetical protein